MKLVPILHKELETDHEEKGVFHSHLSFSLLTKITSHTIQKIFMTVAWNLLLLLLLLIFSFSFTTGEFFIIIYIFLVFLIIFHVA